MAPEEEPVSQAFPWGLKPGGTPDDVVPVRPPTLAPPVDQGHFVAVPDPHALPVQQPAYQQPAYQQPQDVPTRAYTPPPVQHPPQGYGQAPASPAAQPPGQQPYEDLATEAFPYQADPVAPAQPQQPVYPGYPAHEPAPWEPPPVDASLNGSVDALGAQPVGLDAPDLDPDNALESLFGEEKFVAYEAGPMASESPFQRPAGGELVAAPLAPRAPMQKTQKILLGVAGGLVAALALVALFLVGTKLAPAFAPAPPPEVAAPAEPEVAEEVLGPLAPGDYGWNELLGTECIDPWKSPWEQDFTVVDCGQPHGAQLVFRGTFEDSMLDPYPGIEELQSRVNLLCASEENIDYSAANAFSDIQLSASFAASEGDWVEGQRDYFCFVSRSSNEPLTANVAMPDRPAPVIPVTVEPEP